MKSSYDVSLSRLLKDEGGYTNDPHDPGGPTNFGITIFDYRKYINPHGGASDVKNMKLSDAKAIYKSKYWDALNCDELPAGVDYSLFDYGVNSGVGRSKPYLALVDKMEPKVLIVKINDERLAFLKRLRTWPSFGKGWGRRVAGVKAFSLQLADGTVPQSTSPAKHGTAGAVIAAGTAVAVTHPNYWPYIIAGTAVAALVGWLLVHWLTKKD